MALIYPHLHDLRGELAAMYPPYSFFIEEAFSEMRGSRVGSAPNVHSMRKAWWGPLAPDHIERRHGDGQRSTYYITALIEAPINSAIGTVRKAHNRGRL